METGRCWGLLITQSKPNNKLQVPEKTPSIAIKKIQKKMEKKTTLNTVFKMKSELVGHTVVLQPQ